ncbi:MAG: hypothetical protein IJK23_00170 [Clostridia bacterium]|nr:hypothetical protein [Clostridia bacterium]
MSKAKPMKKGVKVFLILLIVLVLLATCFVCVAIYARYEFQKERTWLPPVFSPQQASATELPDNAADAYAYAMRLYKEAVSSDRAEGSWHTDVDLGGDVVWPFSEIDNTLVDEIRAQAAGAVQALYPTVYSVKMSDEAADEIPVIDLKESEILEYIYDPENIFNRKGEYRSDTYEIVFKVDPSFENTDDIAGSEVYRGVCDALKDALTVNSASFEVKEVEIRFRIDRLTDQMQSVDLMRSYDVTADVTLTDAYASLVKTDAERRFTVTLPYRATERISFMWYGLRFTKDYIEQKPDDIDTLPMDVYVNAAAVQGQDFTIEYDISDPETIEIDADAVFTVNKRNDVSDTEGVRVTAILNYEGKTYKDDLIVYISELDKTTTGVRFWRDSFMVAAGETAAMPVDIRVPVNEQSDLRSEEEYELLLDISDPQALSIEIDNKDLFATGLKASADPVTVKITMKCGGHTYYAEIPVTVTEGKEATDNG